MLEALRPANLELSRGRMMPKTESSMSGIRIGACQEAVRRIHSAATCYFRVKDLRVEWNDEGKDRRME